CVHAVRYFHTYIFGCDITLYTDHNSLTFLMHQKQPIPRLQRWILTLDQYRITWVYRKGSTNALAGALSRRYRDSEESAQAQSKLIECDSLACHLPEGCLFKLCAMTGGVFEIITRSKARREAIVTESIPPKPPDNSLSSSFESEPVQKSKPFKNTHNGFGKPLANFDKILAEKSKLINNWVSLGNSTLCEAQRKDDELRPIMELLSSASKESLKDKWLGYYLEDGILYFSEDVSDEKRIVVPKEYRHLLCCEYHSLPTGGHFC
ncbi:MAG: hypothetical protein GY821_15400, partial [Gammaproteobacteria bacterium]|nr:hypothetical protein [Gammaproteobacteria bacterium]